MNNFIKNRLHSIRYACKGAYLLLKTEASIQTQASIALIATIAGFYYQISPTEWILQILTIALIMSIEGLNTAVEKIADFIHPEHHYKIGFIKDIAAGAVWISAIAAIIIGAIIYIPKIF
ncbi:MAG: diacylglycerol kinase family protein [Galbibacter orientalis]|uniref:diacylglycerol kinase n=1 Tax=Galbibacter orientalis TaxID=453852 RepID=UPI003002E18D